MFNFWPRLKLIKKRPCQHSLTFKKLYFSEDKATVPFDLKCFRMVGGVLVERKVGEVEPALTSNRDKVRLYGKTSVLEGGYRG